MSLDFSFAGEANRDNAMSAVADTMNEKNAELLGITMEMGGKQTAKLDGEIYALDKIDAAEVDDLHDSALGAGNQVDDTTKGAVLSLLGIDAGDIQGGSASNASVEIVASATDNTVTISVSYTEESTGKTLNMGVQLNPDGQVTKLSPLSENAISLEEVESNGLLDSWGIDGEDLNPGDLFFIQQKLQIIKDCISTVHTTGKTQGDVMREATQKFSQG